MKDKLLNFLIVLFSLIILVSLAVIFIFYNPSVVTEHFKKGPEKERVEAQGTPETGGISPPEIETQVSREGAPPEVEERVKELRSVLTNYLVYLKGGLERRPALVFKVEPKDKGVKLYLLTYYPMEWPFVKVELGGYGNFFPERVYLCNQGLIIVEVPVRG
ncbi:hypothetical protein, partial [Thermovibrio sp.]